MNSPANSNPAGPAYVYRARLERVIDGDTCELVVDLGFRVQSRLRVRLLGYSAPELRHPGGPQAAERLRGFLEGVFPGIRGEWPLLVESRKDAMSFERWLARVFVAQSPVLGVVEWRDVAELMGRDAEAKG